MCMRETGIGPRALFMLGKQSPGLSFLVPLKVSPVENRWSCSLVTVSLHAWHCAKPLCTFLMLPAPSVLRCSILMRNSQS